MKNHFSIILYYRYALHYILEYFKNNITEIPVMSASDGDSMLEYRLSHTDLVALRAIGSGIITVGLLEYEFAMGDLGDVESVPWSGAPILQ